MPKRTIEYPRPNFHVVSHVCLCLLFQKQLYVSVTTVDLSAYCVCVCRIGLCARDYARVMEGMVLTWCMGIKVQG